MKNLLYLFIFTALIGFNSCSDDDDKLTLPNITVNFASPEVGIDETSGSADIAINLSRTSDKALEVSIKLETSGIAYKTGVTTNPEASDDIIKVSIPAGQTSASIKISVAKEILLEGTEKATFTISGLSTTDGFVTGDKAKAVLSFAAIVSQGQQMTLEGKTAESGYANQVYVDFSTNTQTAIDRKSWDLGFYCGNEFRVFLNPSMQMAAAATAKTNINEVNTSDAEGVPTLVASMMEMKFIDLANVDDLTGDLSKTAISEISATDSENKVYIVAMEGHTDSPANYYKIKVSRNGSGYKIQYGLLGGTEINTVEVSKDSDYNIIGLSFDSKKTVLVEPKSKKWDIMWAYTTGVTTLAGKEVAYFMQDIVNSNNLGGTQVAEVMTETISYENFNANNLSSISFVSARNTIGTNWRVTAKMNGSTEAVGIRANRFYVVKDADGNYYKLKFKQMGLANDGGERGRPVIEYQLVK